MNIKEELKELNLKLLDIRSGLQDVESDVLSIREKIQKTEQKEEIPFVVGGMYELKNHTPIKHILIACSEIDKYTLISIDCMSGSGSLLPLSKKEITEKLNNDDVEYTGKTLSDLMVEEK